MLFASYKTIRHKDDQIKKTGIKFPHWKLNLILTGNFQYRQNENLRDSIQAVSVRDTLHIYISSRALWMLILNNTAPYTKLWFHYNQIRLVFCPNGSAIPGSHASLGMGDLSKVSCCRISPLSWLICTKSKSVIPSFHWSVILWAVKWVKAINSFEEKIIHVWMP